MHKGWTLSPDNWRLLKEAVDELTWRRVPFEILHNADVPDGPGVYMICGSTPSASPPFPKLYNVLYVGLSKSSVRSRFRGHCQNPDTNIKQTKEIYGFNTNKMSFHFANAAAEVVDDIEYRLIECFGPPANRKSGNTKIRGKAGVPKSAG